MSSNFPLTRRSALLVAAGTAVFATTGIRAAEEQIVTVHKDPSCGCCAGWVRHFSPDAVVTDYAKLLKAYGVTTVWGDRYAGVWPRERFAVHGINYQTPKQSASDLYTELLPVLNSHRAELPDNPRLISQLCQLERHAGNTKDNVKHPPGGHDDVANSVAGAIVMALATAARHDEVKIVVPIMVSGGARYFPGSSEFAGAGVPNTPSAPTPKYDYNKEQGMEVLRQRGWLHQVSATWFLGFLKNTGAVMISEIEKCEQTLATLRAKRESLVGRGHALGEERTRLSFAAHAEADKAAQKRLDTLHGELVRFESELTSVDSAIAEASDRVNRAKQAEAQAQAKEVAREIIKRADALITLATTLDDANSVRVEASNAIREELMQMRSIAQGLGLFFPSDEQFLSLGMRAESTAGMRTPFARDIAEHLPPNQRRTHMSYAQQWHDAIVKSARAVLGEPQNEAAKQRDTVAA